MNFPSNLWKTLDWIPGKLKQETFDIFTDETLMDSYKGIPGKFKKKITL